MSCEEGEIKEKNREVEKEVLKELRGSWALEYLTEEEDAVLSTAVKEREEERDGVKEEEKKREERMQTEECKKRSREMGTEEEYHEEEGVKEKKRVREMNLTDVVEVVKKVTNEERVQEEQSEVPSSELAAMGASAIVATEKMRRWRGETGRDAISGGHCDRERGIERLCEVRVQSKDKESVNEESFEDDLVRRRLR
ncbi:uncharacterized protein LOC143264506 [Megachile rotundata]|uniref:uncharacterized protein LOC143264506 n=1 Tax=Megachile rotundata TaxID=143995 RepID=UPI003FCF555F